MIVKDPGKVQGDLSEYMNNMDNCNSKFDGLGSYWKGPSREKLLASVNSFLGEAKVVNTQMTKLASASTAYVDYLELKKICEQLDAKIAAEEAKIDSDGNFYGDQGQINAWKEEIKQHVESMKRYDNSAKGYIDSASSGDVAEVTLDNTDFVSGVAEKV